MQPLISPVDYESRHNSYGIENEHPSERTPLLSNRFPESSQEDRGTFTSVVICLLLMVLMIGVVIGVYLLIEQSKADNILPPVENALQLVTNSQWDDTSRNRLLGFSPFQAKQVIVAQANTPQCWNKKDCVQILKSMQFRSGSSVLPYNFLVSSNGQMYEALGWRRSSDLFPDYPETVLVLGFIGNFTMYKPSRAQVDGARKLLDESVSQRYLVPHFTIVGKKQYTPTYLHESLSKFKEWEHTSSSS